VTGVGADGITNGASDRGGDEGVSVGGGLSCWFVGSVVSSGGTVVALAGGLSVVGVSLEGTVVVVVQGTAPPGMVAGNPQRGLSPAC
jgi:hypothetical protein